MRLLKPRALVTAGGTREPVDDVRVLTNVSRGRFGAAIARALVAAGFETTLLGGHDLMRTRELEGAPFSVAEFTTFSDLQEAMRQFSFPGVRPHVVFMAAAVSDFSPVPHAGKISSDAEMLEIKLKRNPKILAGLREAYGVGTFLVGFKLLSGVSREELVDVAHRQVRANRLNLTVANDLKTLGEDRHPVILVTPEGGAIDIEGDRDGVAADLVEIVSRRLDVRWSRSVRVEKVECPPPAIPEEDAATTLTACAPVAVPQQDAATTLTATCSPEELREARADAGKLLGLVQEMGLLPGTDGNVSRRAGNGLLVTPRQVEKSKVSGEGLIRAFVGSDQAAERLVRSDRGSGGLVLFEGDGKPSIDTPVHDLLYRSVDGLEAMAHFHDVLGIPDATTSFPYPCGTLEEADEILVALSEAAWAGRWSGPGFLVQLLAHGWLLGIERGGVARVEREWSEAKTAYVEHLGEVGIPADDIARLSLSPVIVSSSVVGVLATSPEKGWRSCYLVAGHRSKGSGDAVIRELAAMRVPVAAHDKCEVRDYYVERGFKVVSREGALAVLQSPYLRDDLVPAASVCLVNPRTRRVLVGKRSTEGSLPGYWVFPGGHAEEGETRLRAALRELEEETGIRIDGAPVLETVHHVGNADRAFEVTNFVLPTLHEPRPMATDELEARWMSFDEAVKLRPMGVGTKRVLRTLLEDPLLRRAGQRLRATGAGGDAGAGIGAAG